MSERSTVVKVFTSDDGNDVVREIEMAFTYGPACGFVRRSDNGRLLVVISEWHERERIHTALEKLEQELAG